MNRLVALASLALLASPSQAGAPLRVKASPVVAQCLSSAQVAYAKASGVRFEVVAGRVEEAGSADGFDLVLAAEAETTRLLEGGAGDLDSEVQVASIPWVVLGGDARALERPSGRVLVGGGRLANEARRSLQHLPAGRLANAPIRGGVVRLEAGELAVVPRSLADGQPAAVLSLPPIAVHAFALRGSADPQAARRLLAALADPNVPGGIATCGVAR